MYLIYLKRPKMLFSNSVTEEKNDIKSTKRSSERLKYEYKGKPYFYGKLFLMRNIAWTEERVKATLDIWKDVFWGEKADIYIHTVSCV